MPAPSVAKGRKHFKFGHMDSKMLVKNSFGCQPHFVEYVIFLDFIKYQIYFSCPVVNMICEHFSKICL